MRAYHCSSSRSGVAAPSHLTLTRARGGGPPPSCTWRSVIGSSPGSSGPGPCSSTPNGAAANLASGGMPPVATASGNTDAFASVRPDASR